MKIEDLAQFKDKDLDTFTAETYAKLRLGLDDDWCAYAWSCCIDKNGADEAFDKVDEITEEHYTDEDYHWLITNIDVAREELTGSDDLAPGHMLVKLVNAPNLKVARECWDNEDEMEYKVCLIDWKLVQELAK